MTKCLDLMEPPIKKENRITEQLLRMKSTRFSLAAQSLMGAGPGCKKLRVGRQNTRPKALVNKLSSRQEKRRDFPARLPARSHSRPSTERPSHSKTAVSAKQETAAP